MAKYQQTINIAPSISAEAIDKAVRKALRPDTWAIRDKQYNTFLCRGWRQDISDILLKVVILYNHVNPEQRPHIVTLEAERSKVNNDAVGKLQSEVEEVAKAIGNELHAVLTNKRIDRAVHSFDSVSDLLRSQIGDEKPPISKVNAMPSHKNSVFISYRREDSADVCGRIDDRLAAHFGRENVFKDVDSIPLAVNFAEFLREAVSSCKVFLVVIGKYWLVDASGNRRLNNANDFVRIEIETALKEHKPIIPLQVQGATIPSEAELPKSLRLLSYQNGRAIRRDPDFHKDVDVVIKAIEKIFMT